ncbi:unnamed protein product [Mytilus edulis]|uniref:RNase H type-1 domain-containing protein n=1 Tax=Mytilus edulis TaxID=6550 RepID=A0A8S3SDM8_MYTED|nr:unnamed protein product [Mytilus edulis]
MESMVNVRLKHLLTEKNIINETQSGFREGRSTLDHLLRLETDIKKAKVRKQFLLAIFLDIEKAFDLVWRFGLLKKCKDYVNLMLDNEPIKFQNHVKFLGLIFDRKLTWNKHVNYLQERSKAILNVLRYVQANNYGMGTDSLLMLYKSLLRSVLDYGCQAFNSASITVKSKLDIIQAKALRIVSTPWIIGQAKTSSNIKNSLSKKENPHIIKTKALEYIDNAYKNHLKIYTDGSKDPASGKTGYAFLIPSKLIASYKRTSDNLSVYTTEMTAIYQSLKWVFSNQQPGQKVVILTDSYSAIQSINNNASSRPDILEPIQILACRLKQKNIEVTIEWIPAHVGILGNEQVDKLAKLALSNDKIDLNLSLSANEFIAITTALYKKKWQARWDNTCSIWSRSINTAVNKKPNFYQGNRFHAKTITRLRLGTTLLPGQLGQYIRNVSPICNTCGIKEILNTY